MKKLIEHIEKLLPEHDCVVVPGLGGFVQNEISARFDPRSDIFFPEGKEIGFNAKLTFNDGFLAQAYQESLGLSFEESNIQTRQGVQELQYKIDEGKYVSLGQIGVMWKNEQGQLCFRSEKRSSFCPDAYGLSAFSYPTLEKRLRKKSKTEFETQKQQDTEFINIRLRRNSFRNLIMGTAACLFMILLSKPAGNLPTTGNQEAFLMHNYIAAPEITESAADALIPVDSLSELRQNNEVTDVVPVQEEIQEPVPATVHEIKKESTRSYYIIIGSFPEKHLANDWMKTQSQSNVFKFAGIIESDGRARVYSRSFPNKSDAEAYLNQFRANNPDYATAWLLSVKK